MNVYLRNAHPKLIVHLPLGPGWCRVLRPAVTTRVPEHVLHAPAVRELLIGRLIELVDGAAWDADARQHRASRIDLARAIAAAERAEFDKLRVRRRRETKDTRGWSRWTPELEARLLAEGTDLTALAAELGVARRTVLMRRAALRRSGPRRPHERKRRADEWTPELLARLREEWAAGRSIDVIAAALERTPCAVEARLRRIGLTGRSWR